MTETSGLPGHNARPAPHGFEQVTVIGAGVMGSGIAQTFAVAGLRAVCLDLDQEAIDRARTRIVEGRYGLARAHARGHLDQSVDEVLDRISFGLDVEAGVAGSDLVLEAVPEDLGLKVDLFRRLGAIVPAETVLASNTSGFPITALAHATDRPWSVLGWHWASPPAIMPLAEVIVHPGTDQAIVERITALARVCGKRPVVVKDQPRAWGFVANRLYAAMVAEAKRVVAEGVVTADELDQLMVDCFNWPIGPLGMGRSAREGWTS